ncbi:MAG TPA: M13 family metallopeptidase, partial [Sphingomonadales bacterium]|nr:M13 family metallopeptidase [Sphingomonadales bacterium]
PDPAAAAARVYVAETEIAAIHWPLEDTRDPMTTLKPVAFADLRAAQPAFRWEDFFSALGLEPVADVVLRQDTYFEGLDGLLDALPMDTWRLYLAFHVLDDFAPYLSRDFAAAHFAFHKTALQGITVTTPREREAFNVVVPAFGDMIGRRYAAAHFDTSVRAPLLAMVENLQRAFFARLQKNPWMSEETRRRAELKLEKLSFKIGFPGKSVDYGPLQLDPRDLAGNLLAVRRFAFDREAAALGKPRDRDEWPFPPIAVNAFYDPAANAIYLPAALLQPPLFEAAADPAANYGALGAILGHEIIHAFDDQGRKFDGEGNLANWWTPEDERKFEEEADKLADFYSAFELFPGFAVNGRQTLGENIGDLGGLSLALEAYRISLNGLTLPRIAGFSGEERFFI